jgi:Zn-dependent peptidase ImmA (M78 family)
LWRDHKQASKSANINPLDVIDPVIALEQLGYSVDGDADIGQYQEGGEVFEVAGIIDRESSVVRVSGRFAPAVRNFTIAHELAHAVLHDQSGLHRDRAQDGSNGSRPAEDRLETEANTFASYFLMPAKQVRAAFEQRFLTLDFKLNENTAFALAAQPYADLESRCRTTRDLATMLARTEHYNGKRFHSLANQFGVSVQAMAIRIDELALIRV